MKNLAQVFAFSVLFVTSTAAEDTLRDRLGAFERFGVAPYGDTSNVILHVYTAEQYEANLATLRRFEIDKAKYDEKKAEYLTRSREVQTRFRTERSKDVMDQMRKLRSEAPKKLVEPPVGSKIRLYTKASIGADYIALVPHGDGDTEVLIPLSQIGRVVFSRDAGRLNDAGQPTK